MYSPFKFPGSRGLAALPFAGALIASSLSAQFEVVDDFQAYEPGALAEATGGVWTAIGSTANSAIQEQAGNRFLTYGAGGSQGAYRALGEFSLGSSGTSTFFLRFRANSTGVDNSLGLSNAEAPTGFGNYRVQAALRAPTDAGIRLGVRNAGSFVDHVTDLVAGEWYNLWMVVNMSAGTWDLYFSRDFDDGELITSNIVFREPASSLVSMLLVGNAGSLPLSIDDVHYASGSNTTNPVEEPEEIVITQQPSNVAALVNDEVSFSVVAIGGAAQRSYQWLVSTDGGDSWNEISGATSTTYSIGSVSIGEDGNLYRVRVESGDQLVFSEEALLSVDFPLPNVTAEPADALVATGANHTFTASATGLGTISYQWEKDGAVIGTGSSLSLTNVQSVDAGVYSVRIEDDAATAEGREPTGVTLSAVLTVYNPATAVFLNADDAFGDSSFTTGLNWSDGQAPGSGKDYFTGPYRIRIPEGNTEDLTFGGDSLRVTGGGLFSYKGAAGTIVITVDDLILDGGMIEHIDGSLDHFQLEGGLTIAAGGGIIDSRQGPITIASTLSGTGDLNIRSAQGHGYATTMFSLPGNDFRGNILLSNSAILILDEDAYLVFAPGADGATNGISGTANETLSLNGRLVFDLDNAGSDVGDSWQIVDSASLNVTYGDSFQVDGFSNVGPLWISGSYAFSEVTGVLEVIDPSEPRFIEHPSDAEGFVGGEVTFSAFAYSDPAPSYQWEVSTDGGETWSEITGATEETFTTESLIYADNGNLYRVIATASSTGVASEAASLSVSYPEPTIIQGIADVTVREGDEFSFEVIAEGVGALTYEWRKDDVVLPETGNVLDLGVVDASSGGVYSVTVTDDAATQDGFDPLSVTLTAALSTLDAPAPERAISLNFVGTSTSGTTWSDELGVIAPGETAGVLAVGNWNNSAAQSGVATRTIPMALSENTGVTNVARATWSSANTWAARTAGGALQDKDANQRLFHGYIEGRGGSSVSFSEIPYASYDVYVYPMGVEGPSGEWIRSLTLTDAGGADSTLYMRNYSGNPPMPFLPFRQSTATTQEEAEQSEPATFVRFAGVSGGSFTITHQDVEGGNLGGIAAVSIIDTTPAGTAYPPIITSRPSDQFVPGGERLDLTVQAQSQNEGGSLSYQWRRNGSNLGGETGATLTLNPASSGHSGEYELVITDNSSLGTSSRTVAFSLLVADEAGPVLLSVDVNVGTHEQMAGHGRLRESGLVEFVYPANEGANPMEIGEGDSFWNALAGAGGTSNYSGLLDARGRPLTGVTFAVSGAGGAEDVPSGGGLETTPTYSSSLLRDYIFTEGDGEMTLTLGGLTAFAGREVTLVVYALGPQSTFDLSQDRNDVATVTLAEANDHLGQSPIATETAQEGREVRYNEFALASFEARIAANGTLSWTVGPVAGIPGLNAMNGFQVRLTDAGEALEPEGIAEWRQEYFGTSANEGPAANRADFDGDGFKNLMEYALGTDPTVAGSAHGSVNLGRSGDYLTLSFSHIADPALRYAIEASDNLNEGWQEVYSYGSFASEGSVTYTDTVPVSPDGSRFLRLSVSIAE